MIRNLPTRLFFPGGPSIPSSTIPPGGSSMAFRTQTTSCPIIRKRVSAEGRLPVCMVGGAHHRSAGHIGKPWLRRNRSCSNSPGRTNRDTGRCEPLGCRYWPSVSMSHPLAAQILHHHLHLRQRLPKTQHQTRFGLNQSGCCCLNCCSRSENPDSRLPVGPFVETGHGFQVMVEYIRLYRAELL